jgi:hypothetical protein
MIITISKIAEQTKTSRNGKKYKVVRVEGNKWASEEEWGTDIFKNKTELLEQLDEFGPGDVANFKFVKDGKWPELNEIVEPSKDELDAAKEQVENGGYKKPASRNMGNSGDESGMSKEEWAAKDAATKESIARAVAIKLANDNTKVGTTPESIIKQAVEFLPFLMGEDEILFDTPADPEDALDPPTE